MATRAVHQAASSSECPAAAASSEANTSSTTVASQSEIADFIKLTFGKLEDNYMHDQSNLSDIDDLASTFPKFNRSINGIRKIEDTRSISR